MDRAQAGDIRYDSPWAPRSRALSVAIMVFMVAFAILGVVAVFVVRDVRLRAVQQTHVVLADAGEHALEAMDSCDYFAQTWDNVIYATKGDLSSFYRLNARTFPKESGLIVTVQVVRESDGKALTYPDRGDAAQNALLEVPDVVRLAQRARDSKSQQLSPPVYLPNLGQGVVLGSPVFVPNLEGTPQFWGYTLVVVDAGRLFSSMGLDDLTNDGYDWKLLADTPDGGTQVLHESSEESLPSDCVTYDVYLPGATWHLLAIPRGGFVPSYVHGVATGLSLSLSCVLSVLAYLVIMLRYERGNLSHETAVDPLTGAENVRSYQRLIAERHSTRKPYVLFCIDLNRFKQVNDTYGHLAGDEVLKATVQSMRKAMRDNDRIFRVGGDEFAVVVLDGLEDQTANVVADRLSRALEGSVQVKGQEVLFGASVGWAPYQGDEATAEAVRELADQNMYAQKAASRE